MEATNETPTQSEATESNAENGLRELLRKCQLKISAQNTRISELVEREQRQQELLTSVSQQLQTLQQRVQHESHGLQTLLESGWINVRSIQQRAKLLYGITFPVLADPLVEVDVSTLVVRRRLGFTLSSVKAQAQMQWWCLCAIHLDVNGDPVDAGSVPAKSETVESPSAPQHFPVFVWIEQHLFLSRLCKTLGCEYERIAPQFERKERCEMLEPIQITLPACIDVQIAASMQSKFSALESQLQESAQSIRTERAQHESTKSQLQRQIEELEVALQTQQRHTQSVVDTERHATQRRIDELQSEIDSIVRTRDEQMRQMQSSLQTELDECQLKLRNQQHHYQNLLTVADQQQSALQLQLDQMTVTNTSHAAEVRRERVHSNLPPNETCACVSLENLCCRACKSSTYKAGSPRSNCRSNRCKRDAHRMMIDTLRAKRKLCSFGTN